jgi:hypothetical protein
VSRIKRWTIQHIKNTSLSSCDDLNILGAYKYVMCIALKILGVIPERKFDLQKDKDRRSSCTYNYRPLCLIIITYPVFIIIISHCFFFLHCCRYRSSESWENSFRIKHYIMTTVFPLSRIRAIIYYDRCYNGEIFFSPLVPH